MFFRHRIYGFFNRTGHWAIHLWGMHDDLSSPPDPRYMAGSAHSFIRHTGGKASGSGFFSFQRKKCYGGSTLRTSNYMAQTCQKIREENNSYPAKKVFPSDHWKSKTVSCAKRKEYPFLCIYSLPFHMLLSQILDTLEKSIFSSSFKK